MKTVTQIKVQNSNKNRVSLYLDGKFFCGLELETCVKYSLRVGTQITEDKLQEIQMESEKETAYNKALKLVSVRYKTRKEVERYLEEKGYLPSIIYYVVSKLTEYHFIDDERFVDSYIQSHKAIYGKLKLKQQLFARGISERIIDAALEENEDFDQTEQILKLAQKYMKSKENTKENYIKLFKYLLSKGFEYDEIKRVLKQDVED